MTDPVIEVGPGTVRGPGPVDPELGGAAVEFIDDGLALIDDQPEAVPRLWRNVLRLAAGTAPHALELVCPAWWPAARVQGVADAARTVTARVEVRRRADLLVDRCGRRCTVVEIAPEVIAVWADGVTVALVSRSDELDATTAAVRAAVGAAAAVIVDCPAGVVGATVLGQAIADALCGQGVSVSLADPDWLWQAPEPTPVREVAAVSGRRGVPARLTAVAGAAVLLAAGLVLVLVALPGGTDQPVDEVSVTDMSMTLLVEGRLGVLVPAAWQPQRVTTGPGSARVQVVSPADPRLALHLTQSPVASPHTHEMMAATLGEALRDQPAGVFVDFNPIDHRAGRDAVTYREVRAAHHIDWTVLFDHGVRIAVGCQHPLDQPGPVASVCDQAIRSAHAVF